MSSTFDQVATIIAETCDIPRDTITPESHAIDDLGIDRLVDLKLDARTITVEAQVPTHSTIFEGHFPGYPIMPGVLLLEAMAQTSGWLLIAMMDFERLPFLGAVK